MDTGVQPQFFPGAANRPPYLQGTFQEPVKGAFHRPKELIYRLQDYGDSLTATDAHGYQTVP